MGEVSHKTGLPPEEPVIFSPCQRLTKAAPMPRIRGSHHP